MYKPIVGDQVVPVGVWDMDHFYRHVKEPYIVTSLSGDGRFVRFHDHSGGYYTEGFSLETRTGLHLDEGLFEI